MYEYKIVRDESNWLGNDPKALEHKWNELAKDGWELIHVAANYLHSETTDASYVFMFFRRPKH